MKKLPMMAVVFAMALGSMAWAAEKTQKATLDVYGAV